MVFPLFSLPSVPFEYIALMGRLASMALVMSLLSIVFALFPVPVPAVLKKMIPAAVSVDDPFMVEYLTVLLQASLMKRMVEVPDVDNVLVLLMTRSFVLPVAFTLPSMVTLSAPFRSMSGNARLPVILSPVTVG